MPLRFGVEKKRDDAVSEDTVSSYRKQAGRDAEAAAPSASTSASGVESPMDLCLGMNGSRWPRLFRTQARSDRVLQRKARQHALRPVARDACELRWLEAWLQDDHGGRDS
jgi:hypothetical protein